VLILNCGSRLCKHTLLGNDTLAKTMCKRSVRKPRRCVITTFRATMLDQNTVKGEMLPMITSATFRRSLLTLHPTELSRCPRISSGISSATYRAIRSALQPNETPCLLPCAPAHRGSSHVQAKMLVKSVKGLHMVESVDSKKCATALEKACTASGREVLQVMVQVNTSKEESKAGCDPAEASDIAMHILSCKKLQLKVIVLSRRPCKLGGTQNVPSEVLRNLFGRNLAGSHDDWKAWRPGSCSVLQTSGSVRHLTLAPDRAHALASPRSRDPCHHTTPRSVPSLNQPSNIMCEWFTGSPGNAGRAKRCPQRWGGTKRR
jgi:hypothetical protein